MTLTGDRSQFNAVSFVQSVANYLNISSWRIVMQATFKRDFSAQFIIQPGPDGENNPYQAAEQLQQGTTDGSFANQTGIQASSMQQQNYDIAAVIVDYTAANTSDYTVQLRTFVATFPAPAGVQSQNISFVGGDVSGISIVQISNETDGNYYVQD